MLNERLWLMKAKRSHSQLLLQKNQLWLLILWVWKFNKFVKIFLWIKKILYSLTSQFLSQKSYSDPHRRRHGHEVRVNNCRHGLRDKNLVCQRSLGLHWSEINNWRLGSISKYFETNWSEIRWHDSDFGRLHWQVFCRKILHFQSSKLRRPGLGLVAKLWNLNVHGMLEAHKKSKM